MGEIERKVWACGEYIEEVVAQLSWSGGKERERSNRFILPFPPLFSIFADRIGLNLTASLALPIGVVVNHRSDTGGLGRGGGG